MQLKNPITTSIVSLVERFESDVDLQNGLDGKSLTVNASWPAEGLMVEPCITVLSPNARFTRAFAHDLVYDDSIDGERLGALRESRYHIGSLDITLYVYVFGKTLRERSLLEAGVMNILNTSEDIQSFPDTLILRSANYFNEPIRYRMANIIYSDNEAMNLQSQFASLFSVSCDMNWVVSKKQYDILTLDIEVNAAVSKYVNSVAGELITVF